MDLNADLGESWYGHKIGNDALIMPFLDSCNVACGFHGGDALTMRDTIALAQRHGVDIGAHPSYPDREHFGRRRMSLPPDRLEALLLYQVSALRGMVKAAGARLTHVKAHGALYHDAAFGRDPALAESIINVARLSGELRVYGPEGSHLQRAAEAAGLDFWAEGFADRAYRAYNQLAPRKDPGAVLSDSNTCARQARSLAGGTVTLDSGETARVNIQTICLHGDHRGAAERARAIHNALSAYR